ncbi:MULTISPECIES: hypothetical protein [unclassified Mesorhizobium]|nr:MULTISPECIES: hypothetical protein [unclassified Mesorhizobium]
MDFIENIFGVAPDGGDGTTEMLYIGAALVIAAIMAGLWWFRRCGKERHG